MLHARGRPPSPPGFRCPPGDSAAQPHANSASDMCPHSRAGRCLRSLLALPLCTKQRPRTTVPSGSGATTQLLLLPMLTRPKVVPVPGDGHMVNSWCTIRNRQQTDGRGDSVSQTHRTQTTIVHSAGPPWDTEPSSCSRNAGEGEQ